MLITLKRRRILNRSVVRLDNATWMDLDRLLADAEVDTLVCGGISRATRESILSREIDVIDNVAGTAQEVVEALRRGGLRSGFGLGARDAATAAENGPGDGMGQAAGARVPAFAVDAPADTTTIDCLACPDRPCMEGGACPHVTAEAPAAAEFGPLLEAAWDVACEDERMLCRLAELVYFALEMGYARLGVAFCADLLEPASVLVGVLRRFFDVLPVCCMVGATAHEEQARSPCNPVAQAAVLNQAATDLNVLVGLCVGTDAVFSRASRAPVTTMFVKDKSLANNPIGAVYSHYHLQEI